MEEEIKKTPEQLEAERIEKIISDQWLKVEARAKELTAEKKRTVLPMTFATSDEIDFIDAYFYDLDGLTDVKLAAARLSGPEVSLPKAVQALESLILFDESDPRIRERKYMTGAGIYLLSLVEIAQPMFKKK